tara:strand:+ start:2335 stop:2988 length:654 start_codon:yes stop_codon:yes gene_type:complete
VFNKKINFFHSAFSLLLVSITFIFYYSYSTYQSLVKEDGIIEYLTAIFLLSISIFLIKKLLETEDIISVNNLGIIIFSIIFFFGFGEEISWGQRIFNIETPTFFAQNNLQSETNIHNLMIGGVKLNKLIFTNGLFLIFSFYFLAFPYLHLKSSKVRSFINKFSILLPRYSQSLIFICSTIVIYIFDHERISELWECLFAFTMLITCINPLNKKEVYD